MYEGLGFLLHIFSITIENGQMTSEDALSKMRQLGEKKLYNKYKKLRVWVN